MSNQLYPDTPPYSDKLSNNVNFNYVWDKEVSMWVPEHRARLSIDDILATAKNTIHKFGSVNSVRNQVSILNPDTIWDGGGAYEFPSDTGETLRVVSTTANGDLPDTQSITIEGLDQDFNTQTWTGNLDGENLVDITGTWTRVYRAYNNDANDILGVANIHKSGDVSTSYAQILDGNNQTLMCVYTIPADCTGYMVKFLLTAFNSGSASQIGYTIHLRVREFGKVFRTRTLTSVGTNFPISEEFPFPLQFPPKTDILLNVIGANGNGGSVNGSFDIALL